MKLPVLGEVRAKGDLRFKGQPKLWIVGRFRSDLLFDLSTVIRDKDDYNPPLFFIKFNNC